ncbi:ABC transporter substrate binding protein [Pelotomaculum sp. FP]|uniref:ABC transporter substrate-binding protein n=1 Tax=Pelotomaculum sp. FP TaxID=261474 RepID=UPI00106619D4|nr:ABC transporter substrate-binding protein [Pelotomaculum sp. FP]TEB16028.1 ABC transporter substrate binding protein [Pelotomaculum sp. FP]
MKRVIFTVLAVLLVLGAAGCGSKEQSSSGQQQSQKVELGIIQIVEHPALDAARKGFLDVFAENGYKDGDKLAVDYQNAQGQQDNLQTIANKLAQDKKSLILAIATPSAQVMADKTSEIPILITAVTDPVEAKLIKSMDKPDTNITGTTDMNPIKEQLQLIKDIVPSVKKVGIIYNSSEINSQVQAKACKDIAPELGLEIVEAPITASNEVMQGAQSLVGRCDAVYVPTDNMVVAAISSVVKVGESSKLPVFAAEENSVKSGAIGTYGIDYYKLGRQTGEMALRILKGEKPQEMAIESQKELTLTLNPAAAARMGVTLPEELKAKATLVE